MHWFWRGAISIGATIASWWCLAFVLGSVMLSTWQLVLFFPIILTPLVINLATWAALTRWGNQRIVEKRRRLGQCIGCGYDLTGNESGVCPECGTAR